MEAKIGLLVVGWFFSQVMTPSFAASMSTVSPASNDNATGTSATSTQSTASSPLASRSKSSLDNGPQVQPKPSIQSILTIQQREPIALRQ